jgi:hypothetical protein
MNARDAIRTALLSTQNLLVQYLQDLSDSDLLVRPVSAANHIAWQLGHLIEGEQVMCQAHLNVKYPELPAGYAEKYANKKPAQEATTGFATKAAYLDLFKKTRAATLEGLAKLSDADLDRPTSGPMAEFAPTVGALLILTANHTMMHAGQFSVVRRALGKPVLF